MHAWRESKWKWKNEGADAVAVREHAVDRSVVREKEIDPLDRRERNLGRWKKLGRDFFKIVKARPANYDKQMRLGNAARSGCSSQGLSDFSLSLVLAFSPLPSRGSERDSVFVGIQPSFSRSFGVFLCVDARISLSAGPGSRLLLVHCLPPQAGEQSHEKEEATPLWWG